jgi:ribonucleotide reductase alpha subunit
MYVISRSGLKEPIRYDKITDRNVEFASDLNVDVAKLSKAVIAGLKDGMKTSDIDNLSSETAFYMSTYEPDFDKLAVRIAVSNLHKSTNASFSETVHLLKEFVNPKTGQTLNIISNTFYQFVQRNKDVLNSAIVGTRDFKFSYFGFKTLQRSYLLKCDDKIVERPQYMWMRVAISIHMPYLNIEDSSEEENANCLKKIIESYELMSQFYFTHATPTLFNAGSNYPQCSSCFLMTIDDDLSHIYTTNFRSALISKYAGGIGIDISRVRSKGSIIHSTNGKSNGIVPMIKVFNSTALFVDQSSKRKGSIAMYLEPWHPDVLDFLQLRFNLPPEDIRARDIFLGMWINDLFMKRVEKDEMWSLFCPNTIPELTETFGEEFETIYLQAEAAGKFVKQIKAQEVWKAILNSQSETGLPYMCYKDSVNKKSNQKNIGLVRSSNLCVSGDTKILTSGGNLPINDLVGKKVDVWNGFEWSNVEIVQTTMLSSLIKITTSNNRELKCTKYHKFPIFNSSSSILVDAQDLKIGDKIIDCKLPGFSFDENIFISKSVPSDSTDKIYFELKDVTISNIEPISNLEPTFCFNEPIRHLGIFNGILTGNCTEIMEVTDNDSCAVCNLSSISLPAFVDTYSKKFDFEKLGHIVQIITENLNKIIDNNFYPIEEAKNNNLAYRPIGIGIQGLSDTFAALNYCWGDNNSKRLNRLIAEVIYYNSLKRSCELAKKDGYYSKFIGSPASEGILQYHMWNTAPLTSEKGCEIYLNWDELIESIKKYGLRNSLLIAPMPTASTSQILNNTESFEIINSNIFSRSTLAGDFSIVNKHLYSDLKNLGIWSPSIVDKILAADGSIQHLTEIPTEIRNKYKTVWEISQKIPIDYAADRAPFIDQSQSLNIYIDYPTHAKLTSMHFYGWRKGLKTGSYYIHSKPSRSAVKFTISNSLLDNNSSSNNNSSSKTSLKRKFVCVGEEGCESCSS